MKWLGNRLKILHYYPSMIKEVGGPYTGVIGLSQLMTSRGHEVCILSRKIDTSLRTAAAATDLLECKSLLSRPSQGAMPGVTGLLEGVDIVHIHGMWSPSASVVAWMADSAGIPYIVSLRGMMRSWAMQQKRWKKLPYWWVLGRKLLESASVVHATAATEKADALLWSPSLRCEVIPNYFDVNPYVPQYCDAFTPRGTTLTVCSLGRIHPSKGVDKLLRAVALLPVRRQSAIRLMVAGSGSESYERSLRELASTLGLQSGIEWMGMVSGHAKVRMLQGCDVLVSMTRSENFGFSLFEALASGTHVITTPNVATADYLLASGNATLVKDEAGLAIALAAALDEGHDNAARLGGIAYVRALLDPEIIADRWEDLIVSLRAP